MPTCFCCMDRYRFQIQHGDGFKSLPLSPLQEPVSRACVGGGRPGGNLCGNQHKLWREEVNSFPFFGCRGRICFSKSMSRQARHNIFLLCKISDFLASIYSTRKREFVYYQQKFLILFFHDTANTFRLFLLLPRAANLHNEKTFPSDHSSQPLIFTIQTLVVLLSGSLIYNVNWIFNQWDYVAGVYVIYLCWGEATQSCTHRRLMEKSK